MTTTGPYGDTAELYWSLGWPGPLPLPERRKAYPPRGYTGEAGLFPSFADVWTWANGPEGLGNVALRLPADVLGVDVDAYGDKPGAGTLAAFIAEHGPLPPTYCSTSREDGASGIFLFRVPVGLAFPGELGPGVELIQLRHRYAVVAPSEHPEGRPYRWLGPDGHVRTEPPRPEQLAELPARWVAGLTGGQLSSTTERVKVRHTDALAWIVARPYAGDPMCPGMAYVCELMSRELVGSAHVAARRATLRATRAAGDGHRGVIEAVGYARAAFLADVTAPGRKDQRSPSKARAEWDDLLTSAVGVVLGDPSTVSLCDCYGQLTAWVDDRPSPTVPTDEIARPTRTREVVEGEVVEGEVVEAPVEPVVEAELDPYAYTFARDVAHAARQLHVSFEARAVEAVRVAELGKHELDVDDLAAILARPDQPPARVAHLIPADASTLVVAARKTGKTTLLLNLARSLVLGEPFLGSYAVRPLAGRVAILNYEVTAGQFGAWARDVGVPADRLVIVSLRGSSRRLDDPELVAALRAREVETLVVDPFGRAFTGANQNDAGEVGAWLRLLDVTAREGIGATDVVLATHTGWGGERTRGTSALEDWPDSILTLTRTTELGVPDESGLRYISALGRDVDLDESELSFDTTTRRLSITGNGSRRDARSSRKVSDLAASVVGVVLTRPGVTQRELARILRDDLHVKVGNGAVGDACQAAVLTGQIRREDGPRGANCYYSTRLPMSDSASDPE